MVHGTHLVFTRLQFGVERCVELMTSTLMVGTPLCCTFVCSQRHKPPDEFLTGLTPFEVESENAMDTYKKIMKGEYTVYAETVLAKDLIAGLLCVHTIVTTIATQHYLSILLVDDCSADVRPCFVAAHNLRD